MSEQVLDLRKFVRIVRRHRKLVGIVAAFGLLLGVAYTVLSPPLLTSKTLVVFPDSAPSIATQVVVATSNPVLSRALPDVSPAMSLDTLRTMVQAKSLTAYLISISAEGTTAARAEANADAVANSYVAYVTSGTGVISVAARIFQPATTATGTPLAEQLVIDALIAAICGALIGVVVAAAISRTDRKVRTRDEIANSLGLPVLASLPVAHPTDDAG
jgi:capsular polysaccharide biosynthesis protein